MQRPHQRAIKHRALAMYRGGCRCHADRQRHPQTSRNGDIKQSPRPAGSQADLESAAGPCEAARFTSASWIGVKRHQIHLPLLRWTEPARCHHRVSIGPIQAGFSLPHESHCDSKARKNPTRIGARVTIRWYQTYPVLALQQNTSPNNLIKPVWELGLEGVTYEGG